MNFDQNTLNALLALDDRTLWQTIRGIAAGRNISLPEGPMTDGDMQRLRGVLSGASQLDANEAARIISEYSKRGNR